MYKIVALVVCAVVLVAHVNAQLGMGGGSFMETMLLSQMLSGGGSGGSSSRTPGSTGASTTGAAASRNPFSAIFGGGAGGASGMMGNMGRLMMLNGNTEALMDMYTCGALGLSPMLCYQRTIV